MAKKLLLAAVVVLAILAAFFWVSDYPQNQGTKPEEGSLEDIESDLQQELDPSEADFLKLDAEIENL